MKNKSLLALTVLFCGSFVSLIAEKPTNQMTNGKSPQQPGVMPTQTITPSAQPVVEYGADFFLTADFIWWKVNAEQTMFAMDGVATAVTAAHPSTGHVRYPGFDFEPGFKVGAGLTFQHDGWDLYANYTWLHCNDQENAVRPGSNERLIPLFTLFNYQVPDSATSSTTGLFALTKAEGEWHMHLNVLDVELGRNFWVSHNLALRPHFGLKSAWINQREAVELEMHTTAGINTVRDDMEIEMKQNFWGLGIRTGLDATWHFTKSWGLYGDFSLAALWTDFDSKRKDLYTSVVSGVTNFDDYRTLSNKDDPHTIEPVLEFGLGLFYQCWFHHDSYLFSLSAGWEEQIWFQHERLIDIPDYRTGNMTLQGLTVQAGFSF